MNIRVLFFGATADITGTREFEFEVDEEISLPSVIQRLLLKYPPLANQKLLITVNEEYADADTVLKDGDEIAIFTAVSGG